MARLAAGVLALFGWLAWAVAGHAQVVAVSLSLETNVVQVGSTTLLHVAAQVLPAQRAAADRIFSWYVDLLNDDGEVAITRHDQLLRPVSDKESQTSSGGITDGDHRRGIYDTFMNLPGAGTTNPVVLLVVPITAVAPGQATFTVRQGSGVPGLFADFIVAPLGRGDPWFGGDYSAATAVLTVVSPSSSVKLNALNATSMGGGTNRVEINFTIPAGYNGYVEFNDDLSNPTAWQTLPGAPHNTGVTTDASPTAMRFYRLRMVPAP